MSSRRRRILIVDDNIDDIATYSRWLLNCAERRLTVITASSLASALAIFEEYKPDCILLDYDLRDATGLEFIAELARRGFDPPIIGITGYSSEGNAVEFMKAGARDYLRKSRMSAATLCSAVMAQLSPQAMRNQLAAYRERERVTNGELAAALERVTFLAETGKLFTARLEYVELLGLATSRALPFLGAAAVVDMIEGAVLCRRAVHVETNAALEKARDGLAMRAPGRDGSGGVALALRTNEPVYAGGDALTRARREDVDLAALAHAGIAAAAFLPLRFGGSAIGVLTVGTLRSGGFTELERSVLDDYAQRVAVAVGNARLVESERTARDRAESAKRRLTFQSRISTLFAQSLDWEKALRRLMKILTTSLCDSAAIFTVEAPGKQMRFVAAASQNAELEVAIARHYAAFPPLLSDDSGAGYTARTGRAQFLTNVGVRTDAQAKVSRRQTEPTASWRPTSVISVPLQAKGATVGVLTLVRDSAKSAFGTQDLAVAEDVARRTAIYMENARLYERDHDIASTLQRALLPAQLPIVSDLLFGVRYFAGAEGMEVGGDWYDILEAGSNRLVITVGDVVGRGVRAAVAMGQYRDILRAYTFEGFGPAAALTLLNDLVHALRGEAFATCTIIVLDRLARRMQYASAGHPPPILRLPNGTVRVLDGASSMPIGAWPQTEYTEKTVDLPIGATLVLYTDGLVETRRRSAAEGVDVLRSSLSDSSPDIELMLDGVLRDVAPDRSDDIAILAVEMLPLQSATLKRWVFRGIDRQILRTIRTEFDALLEANAAADADTHSAHLILGELLSNVVRHAPGSFRLELDWSEEYPELRLFDSGPGFAERKDFAAPRDVLAISGRGLFLVSQMSRTFTMTPRTSGGLATRVVLPVRRKSPELELAVR
jgi:serine phosphatase RsbU (regulator of sigma subunit)/CheY-like chemotaxis protein/anti-sigma regulatory factor (Ser/Thr protein kinase)